METHHGTETEDLMENLRLKVMRIFPDISDAAFFLFTENSLV